MFSCVKLQKDSFIRSIVSSKNVKKIFLSPEPLLDDFSKILFYGDCLFVEFHGRRPNSLWGVESQRNHESGHNDYIKKSKTINKYEHEKPLLSIVYLSYNNE